MIGFPRRLVLKNPTHCRLLDLAEIARSQSKSILTEHGTTFNRRFAHAPDGFHPWDVVAMAYLVKPEIFSGMENRIMRMEGLKVRSVPCEATGAGSGFMVPASVDEKALILLMLERLLAV